VTGLDTNVLVRLLTGDDQTQAKRAQSYLSRECTPDSPGFINRVVLAEVVWVLESVYKYGRVVIIKAVEALLRTRDLRIEDAAATSSALSEFEAGADFADALIGSTNELAGCSATVTFDQAAARRLPHFRLLKG
jgi:predicted nucleic-acid-binding protein